MKYLFGFLSLLAFLIATNSFAGYNYLQYKKDFEIQKEMTTAPAEGKLRHTSRYYREGEEPKGTVVPSNTEANKFQNKYDRSYWDMGGGE